MNDKVKTPLAAPPLGPLIAPLALALGLVAVFWHGLFAGVPRADQIHYLHKAGAFQSLWDLLSHSPAWNRELTTGDGVLYRPVLYVLLALEKHFFGYRFVLWQAASLALHIAAVLGLYALLARGSLRGTLLPFALALCCGVSLLGAELVLWNHMAGYLLFCVFAVFCLLAVLRRMETGSPRALAAALVLAGLAEFTYELGLVLCALLALAFGTRAVLRAREGKPWRQDMAPALLFLVVTLAYPAASLADLALRTKPQQLPATLDSLAQFSQMGQYAMELAVHWMRGWLLPAACRLAPVSRANFLSFQPQGPAFWLNLGVLLTLAALLLLSLRRIWAFLAQGRQTRLLTLLGLLAFLGAYALVIAVGRALPRGLDYALKSNIYYSYIFIFALCAGIGLMARPGLPDASRNRKHLALGLSACLLALAAFNAAGTWRLARDFRFDYCAPRQALVDVVQHWIDGPGQGPDAYFTIAPGCPANAPLAWMGPHHLRKNSGWKPPVGLAEALWPEKSYILNAGRLADGSATVTELPCPLP